jgi:hypothetical protein
LAHSIIFLDLISGVAPGAVASGGIEGAFIFRDFVEFLEGYDMAGGNDDANLYTLVQTGSFQEDISNKMDNMDDLLLQQLSSKLSMEDDLVMNKVDLKATTR